MRACVSAVGKRKLLLGKEGTCARVGEPLWKSREASFQHQLEMQTSRMKETKAELYFL